MKPWARRAIYTLLCSAVAGWGLGVSWNAAFEAAPAGTDLASDLDTFIQAFKLETRNRASVETIHGTGSDDNGLLRLGTGRAFMQNATPTDLFGVGQYNAAAGIFGGTPLADEELGASAIDQGTGRFWVDLDGAGAATTQDDRQLQVWVDTVGFQAVRAETTTSNQPLGANLIFNGSFEITDGTGSTASTAVALGWSDLNTATFAYDDPTAVSEGEGVAFETIAAAGADEGATQSLASLKADTDYVIRARVRPVVGTCDLQVTGGDSTQTDTSGAATGVFETLEVVVNTTAGPAALVVRLEANLAADECDWDHVTAFEQDAVVAQPGIQTIFVTDTANDNTIDAVFTNNLFLSNAVTIPGPGYMVQVDAVLTVSVTNETLLARLARDCGGGFAQVGIVTGVTSNPAVAEAVQHLSLSFADPTPTPGNTCTYRVEVREDVAGVSEVNPISPAAVQTGSSLRLMLLPVR